MMRPALLFFACLALAPAILLVVGAARKVFTCPCRINRLQLEGAVIILGAMTASLFFFRFLEAFDATRGTSFAYWFSRGEAGLFLIGVCLFALGFFLERRPRPSLIPWPARLLRLVRLWTGIGVLAVLGVAWRSGAWEIRSWSAVTIAIAWTTMCFAVIYCHRAFTVPEDTYRAEGDLIGIEE